MLQIGDKVKVVDIEEDHHMLGKVGVILGSLSSLGGGAVDFRVHFEDIDYIAIVHSKNLELYREKVILKR